ncbi:hypothetical protein OF83DRAFT_691512 [Amylostereum chailletii]|nr:hypothetical protein OF83DRAFT_691512 [Amylostereum chailletii]
MPHNPLLKNRPSSSNNSTGKNGNDNGEWPEEDVLRKALCLYSKEQLPLARRLGRLKDEFGLEIKLTTLKNLNKHFNVPSSRKAIKGVEATQLVLLQMADDPNGRRGTGAIQAKLAIQGTPLPRRVIRAVLLANDPDGVALRYPGKKPTPIPRGHLNVIGPMFEIHCDGHDKLGALALQMGGVAIPMYAYKDGASSGVLYFRCIPNNRKPEVVDHTFADLVEQLGATGMQITTDHGTEIGGIKAMQTSLRMTYAPDICMDEYPPHMAMKSVHNTPIESMWHWFLHHNGRNLKDLITLGQASGIFHSGDELHVKLFYCIWPTAVQAELDKFVFFWNSHKIRPQAEKKMPSGTTPRDIFTSPQTYGMERAGIPVPREAIQAMRDTFPLTREEAYQWVEPEFSDLVLEAWDEIGAPELTMFNGWDIFQHLEPVVRARYTYST